MVGQMPNPNPPIGVDFGGIAGGILGGIGGIISQGMANATNVELSREAMKFSERMSSTAYQRSMADMQAAGLNPILNMGGGGASAPVGNAAQVAAIDANEAMKGGLSTALAVKMFDKDLQLKDAQINATKAGTAVDEVTAQTGSYNAKSAEVAAEAAKANLPAIKAQAEAAKGRADVDKNWTTWDSHTKRVGEAIGTLGNLLGLRGKAAGTASKMFTNQKPETARERAHRKVRDNFYNNLE